MKKALKAAVIEKENALKVIIEMEKTFKAIDKEYAMKVEN